MICHLAERKTRAAVAAAADFGAFASCRWCVLCAKCQMWKAEKPFLTEEERAERKSNKKYRLRATFHSQHVDIILLQQMEGGIHFIQASAVCCGSGWRVPIQSFSIKSIPNPTRVTH